nr:MAG TPA_asm: hypothetical protein [Caudoviricetes sp.]DAM67891.1 MAG TPA: hypothetical protein [Caudoviricetes sp.]
MLIHLAVTSISTTALSMYLVYHIILALASVEC